MTLQPGVFRLQSTVLGHLYTLVYIQITLKRKSRKANEAGRLCGAGEERGERREDPGRQEDAVVEPGILTFGLLFLIIPY